MVIPVSYLVRVFRLLYLVLLGRHSNGYSIQRVLLYIKPRLDPALLTWLLRFWSVANRAAVQRTAPILRALQQTSLALYQEFSAQGELDFGFEQRGALYLFVTDDGFGRGQHETELLDSFGVKATILDPDSVREMVLAASAAVKSSIYYAEDAHLILHQFVRGLASWVEQNGVHIQPQTEVLGFEVADGRIGRVITTRGNFVAETVVLATGAWSARVAHDRGLNLPIQPAKGYSVTVKRPPNAPSVHVHLAERKVAVTSMGGTLRFAGTLELAGLDLPINQRRVEAIQKASRAYSISVQN